MTAYSVLEQAPVRAGSPPGAAVRDAIALARHVDRLGYQRFWIAEHHAIESVGIGAPEVVIGSVAAATRRIRVGSGGMLLPNHRPLHVAEQFKALAALYPGRIDLGIGRSEGATDAATVLAFGRPPDNDHGAGFERQLDELLAFGGVVPLDDGDPLASVRATPRDVPLPPVFLLGSSPNSAVTAAAKGLGYGFAVHTNPDAAAGALLSYRERFVPRHDGDRPHAILAVRVIVGSDDAHADALAEPSRLTMAQHRSGNPARMVDAATALAHEWSDTERQALASLHPEADVTGSPEHVRDRLAALVEEAQADEVIVITNTFDPAERRASFTRLAAVLRLAPTAAPPPSPVAIHRD